MLHLLKAGRVLQYRQQNVAMLSAPDGAEFTITYATRWLAPDVTVAAGDDALVSMADSPYDTVVPARFVTVLSADHDHAGLTVCVAVGPHPVVETAVTAPPRPPGTTTPWFVWRTADDDIRAPRSDHEVRQAWRAAVTALGATPTYAASTFARLSAVRDRHGRDRHRGDDRAVTISLDEVATAVLEVHSPSEPDRLHTVMVDSDPAGTVAGGISGERADAERHLHVPVRAITGGVHRVELSFSPDPLVSTRLEFSLHAEVAASSDEPEPDGDHPARSQSDDDAAAEDRTGRARALALELRSRVLDANDRRAVLYDHVLPSAPDDPVVRSLTAEAAFEATEYRTVVELLDDPGSYRRGDAYRRLLAGLHHGDPTDVAGLVTRIDLDDDVNVELLRKALPDLPDEAIARVGAVFLEEVAGKEVTDRLLAPVFARLGRDLAARVAIECGPADPDGWLARVLRRWPDPLSLPASVFDVALSWPVRHPALGPHVQDAVDRRLARGDVDDALGLLARAATVIPADTHVRARMGVAALLADDQPDEARRVLLDAASDTAGLGDPDLATALAFELRTRWPDGDDPAVDTAIDRLRQVVRGMDDFHEWRDRALSSRMAAAREVLGDRTLHLIVGAGGPPPWFAGLRDGLAPAAVEWHDAGQADRTWIDAATPRNALVVVPWYRTDRTLRTALQRAGVATVWADERRLALLDAVIAAGPG